MNGQLQVIDEDERPMPSFGVVVQLAGIVGQPSQRPEKHTMYGWVVYRKLDDFHDLHRKLVEVRLVVDDDAVVVGVWAWYSCSWC